MSLRLYEIADEYKFLLDNLIDEQTGEIDETAMSRLNQLNEPLQNKCINTVRALKSIEYECKAIEEERKAMQAREKALKSQVDWIKSYLIDNMLKSGIEEISCPQFHVKTKKNPSSVDIYDDAYLPEEYKKYTISYDLIKIKNDIKSGIDVPGAKLINTTGLKIK